MQVYVVHQFRTEVVMVCKKPANHLPFQNVIDKNLRLVLRQYVYIPDVKFTQPDCVAQSLLRLDICFCLRKMC
jgi:hypothetical protein